MSSTAESTCIASEVYEILNFPLYCFEARLVTPTNTWKKALHNAKNYFGFCSWLHSSPKMSCYERKMPYFTRGSGQTRTNISQALIISGTTNSGPLSCE